MIWSTYLYVLQVRQNYLKTIDNLMQADSESIVQSQRESNSSTK